MLEITRKNCYKCDLETIITNDSQYFWINIKAFEVDTERNWRNIFIKYGNSSTLNYRIELVPNILNLAYVLMKLFAMNKSLFYQKYNMILKN